MAFTCTLDRTDDGTYLATSQEMNLSAEGPTREAAIDSLRREIVARLKSADAVAPPSVPPPVPVDLTVVPSQKSEAHRSRDPSGPGEA